MVKRRVLAYFITIALIVWFIIVAVDIFYYHRKNLEASFGYDIFDNIVHVIVPAIIILIGVLASKYNENIRFLNERNLHINAILRAIRNVNQLIVREKNREQLAREICDNLIEDRGYRAAWLIFMDETGAVQHTARAGVAEGDAEFQERILRGALANCERAALARPSILIFPWDCPDCAGCEMSHQARGDGAMAMRLEHEGIVYGMLRVLTDEKWVDDVEEHSLLIEVAGDIAFSLHTIRIDEERRAAQQELLEQKSRIAEYLRIAGVMFVAIDADETVTLCNRKACDVLGYKESELVGRNWFDILIPEPQRELVRSVFKQLMRGEIDPVEYFENAILTRSGEQRTIAWHNTVLRDDQGRISGTLSSGADITDQRQLEKERARIFDLSIDMLCIAGFDGYFKQINPAWTRTLGWSHDELMAQPWLHFVHPDDQDATITAGEQLSQGHLLIMFENRYRHKDGSWRWISWNSVADEGVIVAVARDVSEEKEHREAIRAGEERLRALSQQLILSQEEERARVAREIHDNLGRLLTALSLETEWIIQTTTSDTTHIHALLKMIDKTTAEMRRICRGLRPIEIERMGLTTSIESLIRETSDIRPMKFETALSHVNAGEVTDETAIAVYRVLQEALNNIVKHASADSVKVELRIENDNLVLDVSDNGRGFPPDDVHGVGLGIEGMRERAHLRGGSLDFISEPGKGVRVIMIVPIVGEGERT